MEIDVAERIMLISAKGRGLEMVGKSNTTLEWGGLMNPLKGGRFDIHFHRRDAERAEDLFNFLLSAETRLTRLSESDGGQGAESKNQQPLGVSTCYCQ